MRDPARIPEVLPLLRAAWEKSPDQRLGQLILNACHGVPNWPDLFHVEADELEKRLQQLFKNDS